MILLNDVPGVSYEERTINPLKLTSPIVHYNSNDPEKIIYDFQDPLAVALSREQNVFALNLENQSAESKYM